MTLYHDNDSTVCRWLGELVAKGHLPAGRVECSDVATLDPATVPPTFHAFAGIGGWAYALRLAGWPDERPVWTGSCPCQPFSCAGKGKGAADKRHLWPVWFRLIRERHPLTILGEQVPGAVGHGWLDGVFAELEGEGYTCGAVVLGAHSVGAPHIRQRIYWVAHANRQRPSGIDPLLWQGEGWRGATTLSQAAGSGGTDRLAHSQHSVWRPLGGHGEDGRDGKDEGRAQAHVVSGTCGEVCGMADTNIPSEHGRASGGEQSLRDQRVETGRVGNPDPTRPQGRGERGDGSGERTAWTAGLGHWSNYDLLPCLDGKQRRTQPGLFPLAHGVPARVGRLRGYGNAIVPQTAAVFIRAVLDHEASLLTP